MLEFVMVITIAIVTALMTFAICMYEPTIRALIEDIVGRFFPTTNDLPNVKAAFKAALATHDYVVVSMGEITEELPVVVAAPDVCDGGEAYSPYSWYNTCARYRVTVGVGGASIWHPLTMRLEMRKWAADGQFFAICNDPAAMCNGPEAISLKVECNLERAFAATFSTPYYGVPYVVRIKANAARAGYIMSLAFRRGIIITPAMKAAEVAAMAFSSRGDTRKSNRGGEERARLQRQARAFIRSQKEVELC